jgi:photosystem II stability/assembly factor-like uncharacterized protein
MNYRLDRHVPLLALLLLLFVAPSASPAVGQETAGDDAVNATADAIGAMRLRGIGPALMGGRIADIQVHPGDASTWYVAVGSGGLWKTTNAGVTWAPVFDTQPSYSIGTVTIDANNPDVVWVGTGENVSGRHVAWGDGLYRSLDGGRSWDAMGLAASEHIGRILVDPRNSDTVLVAAEGPLWSSGGERGVFKTSDAGATWTQVLEINADTGVTDIEFDPSDPDTIYAAAYQRRRHIWSLLGGGPDSGIYKSTDNGDTWRKIERGLPGGDMGKIGLAVTAADPNRVYATIEAQEDERGLYFSSDKGESWERRSSYISGGTGPHYYQEIEASPVDPDLLYQMDVFLHVSRDGGNSFDNLGTGGEKHSDNHALWIDPHDGQHLLAGTDAGLYETFDEGTTWRHFPNMPISQFYKLALDNTEPFYNILGGAQDLGTLLGPSRTLNTEGVRNQDWTVPLGADGYGVAFDPDDPSIMYMETQVGNLQRVDRQSFEVVDIQPQPAPGDAPERFNWDAPLLVSPHSNSRLYFGSQRLWRSDDRGNSWTALSEDLTRNTNRYTLELMDRVWSVDALYDNGAMSQYATITAITESPLQEGVLYTGSDDGLIWATEDGGVTWRQAAALPGVPERSFINDVEASQHAASQLFAVADAHKTGDYSPYVFASSDHGRSWTSIAGDLPHGTIAWAMQQDHVIADLLFLAAERGIYVSVNGGNNWTRLGGAPTIAFRDLKIHRRDTDLVGATFGRGFYVLDDYSPLRGIASGALEEAAALFPVRDAWWYIPNEPGQAKGQPTLGSDSFKTPNPDFGASFRYFLSEVPKTAAQARREREAGQRERGEDAVFPGYDLLREEAAENAPRTLLLVRNAAGAPIRWIEGPARAGLHEVSWDLRHPAPDPIDLSTPGFQPPWAGDPIGPLAAPGEYSVELMLLAGGSMQSLAPAQTFAVKPVPNLPGNPDFGAIAAFQAQVTELRRRTATVGAQMGAARNELRFMRAALVETPGADAALFGRVEAAGRALDTLGERLFGDRIRGGLNEPSEPSIAGRIGRVYGNTVSTRQMPTATQRESLHLGAQGLAAIEADVAALLNGEMVELQTDLAEAGAPYVPGRRTR